VDLIYANMYWRKSVSCLCVIAMLLLPLTMVEGNSNVNPTATIETNKGTIVLELFENDAPKTVENFIRYAEDDFYSGLIFHRVKQDFMIQGGGFEPDMQEKETTYPPIQNEAEESGHRNKEGTIAMARTQEPHSATSQFFINIDDNDFLDWDRAQDGWGYCVFGKVISGMNVVNNIASVETTNVGQFDDVPVEDVVIEDVSITYDEIVESQPEDSEPFYKNILFLQIIISLVVATGIILAIRYKERQD